VLLARQDRVEAFLHQLLAHTVDHRHARLQLLDDLAVAHAFAGREHVRLQKNPRLHQRLGRVLALAQHALEPRALLAAQPHDIFLLADLVLRHHRPLPNQWRK
jgi:hypothetical protein